MERKEGPGSTIHSRAVFLARVPAGRPHIWLLATFPDTSRSVPPRGGVSRTRSETEHHQDRTGSGHENPVDPVCRPTGTLSFFFRGAARGEARRGAARRGNSIPIRCDATQRDATMWQRHSERHRRYTLRRRIRPRCQRPSCSPRGGNVCVDFTSVIRCVQPLGGGAPLSCFSTGANLHERAQRFSRSGRCRVC